MLTTRLRHHDVKLMDPVHFLRHDWVRPHRTDGPAAVCKFAQLRLDHDFMQSGPIQLDAAGSRNADQAVKLGGASPPMFSETYFRTVSVRLTWRPG